MTRPQFQESRLLLERPPKDFPSPSFFAQWFRSGNKSIVPPDKDMVKPSHIISLTSSSSSERSVSRTRTLEEGEIPDKHPSRRPLTRRPLRPPSPRSESSSYSSPDSVRYRPRRPHNSPPPSLLRRRRSSTPPRRQRLSRRQSSYSSDDSPSVSSKSRSLSPSPRPVVSRRPYGRPPTESSSSPTSYRSISDSPSDEYDRRRSRTRARSLSSNSSMYYRRAAKRLSSIGSASKDWPPEPQTRRPISSGSQPPASSADPARLLTLKLKPGMSAPAWALDASLATKDVQAFEKEAAERNASYKQMANARLKIDDEVVNMRQDRRATQAFDRFSRPGLKPGNILDRKRVDQFAPRPSLMQSKSTGPPSLRHIQAHAHTHTMPKPVSAEKVPNTSVNARNRQRLTTGDRPPTIGAEGGVNTIDGSGQTVEDRQVTQAVLNTAFEDRSRGFPNPDKMNSVGICRGAAYAITLVNNLMGIRPNPHSEIKDMFLYCRKTLREAAELFAALVRVEAFYYVREKHSNYMKRLSSAQGHATGFVRKLISTILTSEGKELGSAPCRRPLTDPIVMEWAILLLWNVTGKPLFELGSLYVRDAAAYWWLRGYLAVACKGTRLARLDSAPLDFRVRSSGSPLPRLHAPIQSKTSPQSMSSPQKISDVQSGPVQLKSMDSRSSTLPLDGCMRKTPSLMDFGSSKSKTTTRSDAPSTPASSLTTGGKKAQGLPSKTSENKRSKPVEPTPIEPKVVEPRTKGSGEVSGLRTPGETTKASRPRTANIQPKTGPTGSAVDSTSQNRNVTRGKENVTKDMASKADPQTFMRSHPKEVKDNVAQRRKTASDNGGRRSSPEAVRGQSTKFVSECESMSHSEGRVLRQTADAKVDSGTGASKSRSRRSRRSKARKGQLSLPAKSEVGSTDHQSTSGPFTPISSDSTTEIVLRSSVPNDGSEYGTMLFRFGPCESFEPEALSFPPWPDDLGVVALNRGSASANDLLSHLLATTLRTRKGQAACDRTALMGTMENTLFDLMNLEAKCINENLILPAHYRDSDAQKLIQSIQMSTRQALEAREVSLSMLSWGDCQGPGDELEWFAGRLVAECDLDCFEPTELYGTNPVTYFWARGFFGALLHSTTYKKLDREPLDFRNVAESSLLAPHNVEPAPADIAIHHRGAQYALALMRSAANTDVVYHDQNSGLLMMVESTINLAMGQHLIDLVAEEVSPKNNGSSSSPSQQCCNPLSERLLKTVSEALNPKNTDNYCRRWKPCQIPLSEDRFRNWFARCITAYCPLDLLSPRLLFHRNRPAYWWLHGFFFEICRTSPYTKLCHAPLDFSVSEDPGPLPLYVPSNPSLTRLFRLEGKGLSIASVDRKSIIPPQSQSKMIRMPSQSPTCDWVAHPPMVGHPDEPLLKREHELERNPTSPVKFTAPVKLSQPATSESWSTHTESISGKLPQLPEELIVAELGKKRGFRFGLETLDFVLGLPARTASCACRNLFIRLVFDKLQFSMEKALADVMEEEVKNCASWRHCRRMPSPLADRFFVMLKSSIRLERKWSSGSHPLCCNTDIVCLIGDVMLEHGMIRSLEAKSLWAKSRNGFYWAFGFFRAFLSVTPKNQLTFQQLNFATKPIDPRLPKLKLCAPTYQMQRRALSGGRIAGEQIRRGLSNAKPRRSKKNKHRGAICRQMLDEAFNAILSKLLILVDEAQIDAFKWDAVPGYQSTVKRFLEVAVQAVLGSNVLALPTSTGLHNTDVWVEFSDLITEEVVVDWFMEAVVLNVDLTWMEPNKILKKNPYQYWWLKGFFIALTRTSPYRKLIIPPLDFSIPSLKGTGLIVDSFGSYLTMKCVHKIATGTRTADKVWISLGQLHTSYYRANVLRPPVKLAWTKNVTQLHLDCPLHMINRLKGAHFARKLVNILYRRVMYLQSSAEETLYYDRVVLEVIFLDLLCGAPFTDSLMCPARKIPQLLEIAVTLEESMTNLPLDSILLLNWSPRKAQELFVKLYGKIVMECARFGYPLIATRYQYDQQCWIESFLSSLLKFENVPFSVVDQQLFIIPGAPPRDGHLASMCESWRWTKTESAYEKTDRDKTFSIRVRSRNRHIVRTGERLNQRLRITGTFTCLVDLSSNSDQIIYAHMEARRVADYLWLPICESVSCKTFEPPVVLAEFWVEELCSIARRAAKALTIQIQEGKHPLALITPKAEIEAQWGAYRQHIIRTLLLAKIQGQFRLPPGELLVGTVMRKLRELLRAHAECPIYGERISDVYAAWLTSFWLPLNGDGGCEVFDFVSPNPIWDWWKRLF